jgi:hypothetical protein
MSIPEAIFLQAAANILIVATRRNLDPEGEISPGGGRFL